MNITAVEKMMFKVMKAVFDSGIPINFKGSMVLKEGRKRVAAFS